MDTSHELPVLMLFLGFLLGAKHKDEPLLTAVAVVCIAVASGLIAGYCTYRVVHAEADRLVFGAGGILFVLLSALVSGALFLEAPSKKTGSANDRG